MDAYFSKTIIERQHPELKILQVVLAIEIGGLETVTLELSRGLVQKGVPTEILCLNAIDHQYASSYAQEYIPIHLMHKQSRWDIGFFRRVSEFIRHEGFNLVHAHSGCFFNGALFSCIAGVKKFIYTAHGMPANIDIKSRCEDIVAGLMADCIVPVSHELEIFLKRWQLFNRCKYATIINGIDTNRFKPVSLQEKERLIAKYNLPIGCSFIGTVGRLEPVKNQRAILKAYASLHNYTNHNPHVVFVGEGSCLQELKLLAEQLGIGKNVHFLGMQYHINEILPLFDVFVLPSFTEGTSISLLEAQSCGVPAVVSDVGGNGFIISHGANGYLLPVDQYKAMAGFIADLIATPELSSRMGREARLRVKSKFSLQAMVNSYHRLYQDC